MHAATWTDVIVTFHWDQAPNPFGVPGTQFVHGLPTADRQTALNGHGRFEPMDRPSTLLLAGPDFRHNVMVDAPRSWI
jgi:hypothetical protein